MTDFDENEFDRPMSAAHRERVSRLTPEEVAQIDAALLSAAGARFQKVAMVVASAMIKLETSTRRVPDLFYSERVRHLVETGVLESVGDLRRMCFSEVRVPTDSGSHSAT